jgi:hypothetical protein
MVTVDYMAIRAEVAEAMAEVSQGEIKIAVTTPGNGPAHNPGRPTVAYTTLNGAADGVTKEYQDQALEVGADMVVKTEVIAGIDPELSDHLLVDGIRREIAKFKPKPSAGIAVQWIFFVKGAGVTVDEEA